MPLNRWADAWNAATANYRGPAYQSFSKERILRGLGRVSIELALADDHVALATQHIARQKEIVSGLQERGYPSALAEDLLETFELTLVQHLRHRERLHLDLISPERPALP